ncbi:MFS transporter [Rhizorhabdus dicambivorans]|uniref:MFS transporter n=1 Tax=Rhizorhabdus dicambivorans TaxID=1850238 RepID=A0A2A4FRK1_9SPHN|nr:MFS transporter [Rhizorhabdus dicambivorans]ATE65714.1 MFS transporter [Rhizorhabdus dicambivorans]PCE40078.1 MFS transporter [Rhizorhabdus dicambivorans]
MANAIRRIAKGEAIIKRTGPPYVEPSATDDVAARRLGSRLIQRLALPLALLTFVNAIDRVNISFAADAMRADLALSPEAFGFGVSAFFVAYLLFQYPHAALLRRYGIRRWLLGTVMLWGLAGVLLACIASDVEFVAVRFLLGIAEAGFAPGITWIINRWLPEQVRAKAMATVLAAVPLSLVLGGPLCGWMLGLGGPAGISAWRWMFLFQALPNVLLAALAFGYFPDDLGRSSWLTPSERKLLASAAAPGVAEPIGASIRDPRVWRCALAWLLVMTGAYALVFWLPQLVRQMHIGHTEFEIGVLAAFPQLGLVLGLIANGRHSDRTGERQWHVGLAAMLGGVALLAGALFPPNWTALLLFAIAGFGIGGAQSVFWALPSAMGIGSDRISVAAISLISMCGTVGGVIGPMLIGMVQQMTGSFLPSLVTLALMLVAGGIMVIPLSREGKVA